MKKILLLFISLFFSLFFIKKTDAGLELCEGSKAAILYETTTSKILYNKNENEKLPMASMTKVMTLAIIYDEIKKETISLDTQITTSSHAASMGGSQVFLEEGETHPLSEMLKCICIASANDCAVAVAEHIAGSEELFVKRMNEKTKVLNMNNTLYNDVTGLSDNNHYTSALDMAIVSAYLINTHPEVLEYTSLKEGYFRDNTDDPFWLVNTNKLVGRQEGVDGLKTGVLKFYCEI